MAGTTVTLHVGETYTSELVFASDWLAPFSANTTSETWNGVTFNPKVEIKTSGGSTQYRFVIYASGTPTSKGSTRIIRSGTASQSYGGSVASYTWRLNVTVVQLVTWYATLEYDANGGSGAPSAQQDSIYAESASGSVSFTIPATVPTRDGWTFAGWGTSSSAASATYQAGGTVTVSYGSTTTLYAVWSKVYTAAIAIDVNGGSGTIEGVSASATYTEYATKGTVKLTIPTIPSTVTRTGYKATGYNTDKSATSMTALYPAGGTATVTYGQTLQLYVIWCPQYVVAFVSDGATVRTVTLTAGTTAGTANIVLNSTYDPPARDGYVFRAWSDASGIVYTAGGSIKVYKVTADVSLTAVWRGIPAAQVWKIWDGDADERFTYEDWNRIRSNLSALQGILQADSTVTLDTSGVSPAVEEVTRASMFCYDQAQSIEDTVLALATAQGVSVSMTTDWCALRSVSYIDFERWESSGWAVYRAMGGTSERTAA